MSSNRAKFCSVGSAASDCSANFSSLFSAPALRCKARLCRRTCSASVGVGLGAQAPPVRRAARPRPRMRSRSAPRPAAISACGQGLGADRAPPPAGRAGASRKAARLGRGELERRDLLAMGARASRDGRGAIARMHDFARRLARPPGEPRLAAAAAARRRRRAARAAETPGRAARPRPGRGAPRSPDRGPVGAEQRLTAAAHVGLVMAAQRLVGDRAGGFASRRSSAARLSGVSKRPVRRSRAETACRRTAAPRSSASAIAGAPLDANEIVRVLALGQQREAQALAGADQRQRRLDRAKGRLAARPCRRRSTGSAPRPSPTAARIGRRSARCRAARRSWGSRPRVIAITST